MRYNNNNVLSFPSIHRFNDSAIQRLTVVCIVLLIVGAVYTIHHGHTPSTIHQQSNTSTLNEINRYFIAFVFVPLYWLLLTLFAHSSIAVCV